MSVHHRESIYDQIRQHLDAPDLIRRLGIEEVRVLGSESYCRPLCHESSSGQSLQINLQTGRWNCKACQHDGFHGDLFQLVEYVLTGGQPPSRGKGQGTSTGHRQAISWLCEQFGIAFNDHRMSVDPGLAVVHTFSMAAHEHLLRSPEVMQWIEEKWGFDRTTIEAYGIGFMPSPMLPAIAAEATRSESKPAFVSSGLGWHSPDQRWNTRFEGRILFPYLEHGRAVYLIGRATPWTPLLSNGATPPKYHKLSVHSDSRPHISKAITNDHLYNETVMATIDEIGVLEGVTDEVAVSSLGVAAVSPVTISFNKVDLERFIRKCHENGIRKVWILFDNELSGSGNWASRRVGKKLVEGGLAVDILTLPLGEKQTKARDEVVRVLGDDLFIQLERLDPRKRKDLIADAITDQSQRDWLSIQIEESKIDAAEWCALEGAGAAGKFDSIKKSGSDVIHLEAADVQVDPSESPSHRANAFSDVIALAAHVEDRLERDGYASHIAKLAGKGVPKAEIARRIAHARKQVVKPKRDDAKDLTAKSEAFDASSSLVLLPPEKAHNRPAAPEAPADDPTRKKAPLPPGADASSDHERYAPVRDAVAKAVEAKYPEEQIGDYVSQTILKSMGYTPFRTPDDLFLIRGSNRIALGLSRHTPAFIELLWLSSGLTPSKSSHRAYIAAIVYFISKEARHADDVSWSFVDADGSIFFPQGDPAGSILKIKPGEVTRTRMADARVPAVAGDEFRPFNYIDQDGGIDSMLDVFRWTSLPIGDRIILIYWIVCLPVLRLRGTVPIVRVEGGSSSGKTRTVDAVSMLVNGRKSGSVPTSAALVSRMSTEMLTIDDNREAIDVDSKFLGTLLQATHLGAREKRRGNSDTGTVVERICGALLMNGIEPIHDGRSELVSRMITLHCSPEMRAPDSPTSNAELSRAILGLRDSFWSESPRRCAMALEMDRIHGERIGTLIEEIFGATRIGRLSSYLRIMYLAWVSGLPPHAQMESLQAIAPIWADAFGSAASTAMQSLLGEELTVSVMRYIFAHGIAVAEPIHPGMDECHAFKGKFVYDKATGDAYAGPLTAPQLARLARTAGKELNAPRAITSELRAGQLEKRILDGLAFLEAAGYEIQIDTTKKRKNRFTIQRLGAAPPPPSAAPPASGDLDTWIGM